MTPARRVMDRSRSDRRHGSSAAIRSDQDKRPATLRISAPARAARDDRPAARPGSSGRSRGGRSMSRALPLADDVRMARSAGYDSVTSGRRAPARARPSPFWCGRMRLTVTGRTRRSPPAIVAGSGFRVVGRDAGSDRAAAELSFLGTTIEVAVPGVAHRLVGQLEVVVEACDGA